MPFLPLQSLWVIFTSQVFLAFGMGYGKPAEGLMGRKPRPPVVPLLPRGLIIWLIGVGVVMGAGTLGVISWAEQARSLEIAHTMGLVTFSLFNLFFSMAVKDERKTVFSLDTFSDRTFGISTGLSVLTIILATVLGPLQRFLETTPLDVQQWLICLCVALSIIVISEIRKVSCGGLRCPLPRSRSRLRRWRSRRAEQPQCTMAPP